VIYEELLQISPGAGNSTTKNHATVNHSRFNICLHMRPPFSNALPAALQAVIYEELLQISPGAGNSTTNSLVAVHHMHVHEAMFWHCTACCAAGCDS
jgi:hypothetical protein